MCGRGGGRGGRGSGGRRAGVEREAPVAKHHQGGDVFTIDFDEACSSISAHEREGEENVESGRRETGK